MPSLNAFEEKVRSQPDLARHGFSDVFSLPGGKPIDFDAELTTHYRGLRPRDTEYGIDGDLVRGAYGVELVCQLVDTARGEIERAVARSEGLDCAHPNVRAAHDAFWNSTPRVLANSAPRDGRFKNGSPFYLAITDNGVEITATPLELLSGVRHRVVALFELPNEGHPLYDGRREQFRSSVVVRSHEVPDHWKLVWRKGDPDKPCPIPDQAHKVQLAYVDQFGNMRLRERPGSDLLVPPADSLVQVQIGETPPVRARLTNALDAVAVGDWALYRNVADGVLQEGQPAYWELLRKWTPGDHFNSHELVQAPPLGSSVRFSVE